MTDQLVHHDVHGGVATITLDSPHNRNALSRQLVTELLAALHASDKEDSARVVVLRATGTVFCSGADLSEASTVPMAEGTRGIVRLQRAIAALTKPVVTRVHGAVRAGGLGLVGASDVVVAAERATFALTEVRLGLAPAAISLSVLPRLSSRAAAYTFLSGEVFDATYAAAAGVVTKVVPEDRLDEEVEAVVASLLKGSPQGLRETKRLLVRDLVAHIDAHGEDMASLSARLFGSEEARAAMTAFLSRKA